MKCRRFCGTLTYRSISLRVSDSVSITDQVKAPIVAPASNDAIAVNTEIRRTLRMRSNLSANLLSTVFGAVLGLICAPIYLRTLGLAPYGLIGLWLALEAATLLVDMGITSTIVRELAVCTSSRERSAEARDLVLTLEIIYWGIGLAIGATVLFAGRAIAAHWVKSAHLSPSTISNTISMIALLMVARWPLSFYYGGLQGLERQVFLGGFNGTLGVVRHLSSVIVVLFVDPSILAYFTCQIVIAVIQTISLRTILWHWLPKSPNYARFRMSVLKRVSSFALGIGAIGVVSYILGDLDKLIVSGLVPLEAFGIYTLAWRIANSLSLLSSPLFNATFPALSRLASTNDSEGLKRLYHRICQASAVLIFPLAVVFLAYSRMIIWLWTGNSAIAASTAGVASVLVAGTAINCSIGTMSYGLQLAKGWTAPGFYTNLVMTLISVPLLFYLTRRFGLVGAASVWLAINLSYPFTIIRYVHQRLWSGEHRVWYLRDVAIPLSGCSLSVFVCRIFLTDQISFRLSAFVTLAVAAIVASAVTALSVPVTRDWLRRELRIRVPRLARA
jgi:O-antigen/teichoic acid export membrane protein